MEAGGTTLISPLTTRRRTKCDGQWDYTDVTLVYNEEE